MYLNMSDHDILDHVISLHPNPKTVIDIGAYYCGWSNYMADQLPNATVYAVQSPNPNKLNHIKDTDRGENSQHDIDDWKKIMKDMLPTQYHEYYDFNLFAEQVNKRPNVIGILDQSPMYNWQINYDICMVTISKDYNENFTQYKYWREYSNPNGILLLAAYEPLDYDCYDGPLQTRDHFINAVKTLDPDVIDYDSTYIINKNTR